MLIPQTQGELIRTVRGKRSQSEFAKTLGCDRSCLSRYENESLGAPTSVINFCLKAIAQEMPEQIAKGSPMDTAMRHAKEVVHALECMKTLIPKRL
jgi:DNA-binding XRE family transcriptional regulator